MKLCLFCNNNGPFNTLEHIIPESLGNDDLLLSGEVCDACQNYFGKEVENFVLNKTPLAFWRTYLGIRKKRGKLPSVDLSQSKLQKGITPSIHPYHDNINFTAHKDGTVEIASTELNLSEEILHQGRNRLNVVLTPLLLQMLGRFLCKVGLELICSSDSDWARSHIFDKAREYARFGTLKELWPIFHFSKGNPNHFIKLLLESKNERYEEVECYSYKILDVMQKYVLFHFVIGTDNWVISLNEQYPTPLIRNAFPEDDLVLIWYSPEEWRVKSD